MSLHKIILSVAATALTIGIAAPASAQLYSWRDPSGNIVISNLHQADGSAPTRTYTVSKSTSIRTTRYVAPSRSGLYDAIIDEHASMHGVRADLVRAVVQVESAFNTYARSPKGALGLMQLMPGTMRDYGVRNPFDPVENIRAGVQYLRSLLDRYENDETLALAAYNAGPTAVDNHGLTVPPYRETKNYVKQVNKLSGDKSASSSAPVPGRLYKVIEYVDGRAIPKIVNEKPKSGIYEVVGAR